MAHAMIRSSDPLATLSQTRSMPVLAVVALRIAVVTTKWSMNARTRAALASLEPHQLRDVGVTPVQARKESARAFWLS